MSEAAQAHYFEATDKVRARFGADVSRALAYYSPLVEFVAGVSPCVGGIPTRLLDVGCGAGWSTYAFATAGYDSLGIDLDPSAFEPPPHERCRLEPGNATAIPHLDDTFDVVVCYQCLEHVLDPARALDEMSRVCRPGGVVAIVGPNLVSPTRGLAYAARPSSWRSLKLRRRAGMPRNPYGNTLPEILGIAVLRKAQLMAKLVRRSPVFSMREPDTVPPSHADNDACYLCNPTDLIRYFGGNGYAIERRGKPGRPPLSYLIAGGTWVAARKPS